MSLHQKSAVELLGLLDSGDVTSEEVTRSFLRRIADVEPRVKAFLRVDAEAALAQARAIDARRRRGE